MRCQELIAMMRETRTQKVAREAFFRAYQPIVYQYLRSRSSSLTNEDIQDISQEFFMKIYDEAMYIDTFEKSCEAWWRTVCKNMMIDWLRKKRCKPISINIDFEPPIEDKENKKAKKIDELWECIKFIVLILKKTHPKRLETCNLLVMGYKRQEIANLLNESPNVIGNRIFQIREQLNALKNKHCE